MCPKIITFLLICFSLSFNAHAQKYLTRNGKVTFFSKATIENIDAINDEVTSIIDTKKGEVAFNVLIKSFKFKKALMEEHFNENYMESNTYPKASFKGNIVDISKVNFTKDGTYTLNVKGDLTMHGVTKNLEAPASIIIAGGRLSAISNFKIKLKDFNIKIPATVVNNIAELIAVSVECKYEAFKK